MRVCLLQGRCVPLICPYGRAAIYGQCLNNPFSTVYKGNITMAVHFRLVFTEAISEEILFGSGIVLSYIVPRMTQTVGDCDICEYAVYVQSRLPILELILYFAVTESDNCLFNNFHANIPSLEAQFVNASIIVNVAPFKLTFSLLYTKSMDHNMMRRVEELSDPMRPAEEMSLFEPPMCFVNVDDHYHCPAVLVDKDLYGALSLLGHGDRANLHGYVCVSDLAHVLNLANKLGGRLHLIFALVISMLLHLGANVWDD